MWTCSSLVMTTPALALWEARRLCGRRRRADPYLTRSCSHVGGEKAGYGLSYPQSQQSFDTSYDQITERDVEYTASNRDE